MDSAFEEKLKTLKKSCPKCKTTYYGTVCPTCGGKTGVREYFEDPDFEDYVEQVEADNKEVLKWENVSDDDVDKLEEELNAESS